MPLPAQFFVHSPFVLPAQQAAAWYRATFTELFASFSAAGRGRRSSCSTPAVLFVILKLSE